MIIYIYITPEIKGNNDIFGNKPNHFFHRDDRHAPIPSLDGIFTEGA
jgi:hypothetical protein